MINGVANLHELQIILEDIRNQLTIAKGFVQLHKNNDPLFDELVLSPINNADRLTKEALNIIEITKPGRFL